MITRERVEERERRAKELSESLLDPLNDAQCLRLLHASVEELRNDPWLQAFALRFETVAQLVGFIRSLEQRDDLGDPSDGPRLACNVSQRLRYAPSDPNCFERVRLFLAAAPLIDPDIVLSSASMVLDNGWHTFPVEIRNGIPHMVVLDPSNAPPRNTMMFTAWNARNLAPNAPRLIAPWFDGLTRNACIDGGAQQSYHTALESMRNGLLTGEPLAYVEHIEHMFALAEPEADLWRARGRKAFERMAGSVRNLGLSLDSGKVGNVLGKILDSGKEMAPHAIRAALIAEFGPAAALALKGVDLAQTSGTTRKGKAKKARKTTKKAQKAQKKRDRRARLRRMTLAFR